MKDAFVGRGLKVDTELVLGVHVGAEIDRLGRLSFLTLHEIAILIEDKDVKGGDGFCREGARRDCARVRHGDGECQAMTVRL